MKSDIEISRQTELLPITEIAQKVTIPTEELIPYGKYIAKLPLELISSQNDSNKKEKESNLILVTAITPTKAGVGKTTTSVGLGLGLAKIGKKAIVALREPSLGPCFGMKGGAAGGGYAQVLPMENINLHFTGDFHAITSANNMIAALLDNYQFQNRGSENQLRQILWKRVLDVNDRSLRNVVTGLGSISNGVPTETGFDITPASEIMAILCLATDLEDLKQRIGNILLGYRKSSTTGQGPVFIKDLGFEGAITVLLKDAIQPNLVQTTENTASIIHGGPFANIAHGCNSVLATKMALNFADYVVTEAGFGADLGAEKFMNIKCRKSGLSPKVTVIVATSQALKLHGKVAESEIKKPNLEGIKEGTKNLEKHIENMQSFGQSVVVAFNKYDFDTDEEIEFLKEFCQSKNVNFAINNGFLEGGKGAEELAKTVVEVCQNNPSKALEFTYKDEDTIETKIRKVAQKIYGANDISLSDKAQKMLSKTSNLGFSHFPVCIAKTQYSFSDDAKKLGVAKNFTLHIEDLVINSGAEFIVAVSGTIMRMPGLPKEPQALKIDIKNGSIEGLS
ncbi:formate--tetrahydrofolate ligase [Bernardetia sp. ABR2-2B]|uniref:formate--tetrahydrofolate ligase n=1 Tax=Bernardetia sp. ABR2-2B TaxID=3127472 RepID=UPI0030D10AC1